MRSLIAVAALFTCALHLAACGDDTTDTDASVDTGIALDAGRDSGVDASAPDTGVDAGIDAGQTDTGVDAGEPDTGADAGPLPVCGNDVVEQGEDCDDGNATEDDNGCSADCLRLGRCGDGLIQSLFEACDSETCCASDCSGPALADTECRAAGADCDVAEVCDGTSLDCPVDELAVDGTSCDDCTAGSGSCDTCLDGACADRRFFCSDILLAAPNAADGLYEVNPAVTPTTGTDWVTVFCDMSGGGWTMVHKKSRTAPGDAGLAWTSGATNSDDLSLMHRGLSSTNYTSRLVETSWEAFAEARVEVVTGTVVAQYIEFDAVGSDTQSWFAPERHTSSSWTDLPIDPNWTNNNGRFFDIEVSSARDWYVNLQWGGCPADRGWLVLTTSNFCYWENLTPDPVEIIYSRLPVNSSTPDAISTGRADSLVVFVR